MDRIAAFGPRMDNDIGIIGYLQEPIGDRYGCNKTDKHHNTSDWIALVERGECSFIEKVLAMQSSGAIAVIVGDKNFNGWVTMYAPGNNSTTTSSSLY